VETVNAISKVRFSSARPQVVQLHKSGTTHVELLCMEPGQKLKMDKTPLVYYVITGSAEISSKKQKATVQAGHTVSIDADEIHAITSPAEGRLVCLVISPGH